MKKRVLSWVLLGALLVGFALFAFFGFLQGGDVRAEEAAPKAASAGIPERELSAQIDREIAKVWKEQGVKPAKLSSDEEFLRRVYLETVGVLPTEAQARTFLADRDKDKRRKLIEALVDDPRFGEHMADLWTNVLMGRGDRDRGGASSLLAIWLSEKFNEGVGFDEIVYDLVSARGSLSENPAVALYVGVGGNAYKATDAAGQISKNLMGVQIQCAQCHDHPYEDITTDDFAGMASFFAPVSVRIDTRSRPVDPAVGDDVQLPKRLAEGYKKGNLPEEARARIEEALKYNKPVTLDKQTIRTQDRTFWRPWLAKWMSSAENAQTLRYLVNRFWSFAFGQGIVSPPDDFNSFNEPSHPELLDLLAEDFREHDFDYKRLFRAILNSDAWQLSSRGADDKAEAWHFASYPVRQMTPEQMFGALVVVAGGDEVAQAFRRQADPLARIRKDVERAMRMEKKDDANQRAFTYDEEALARFEEWFSRMDSQWFLRRTLAGSYASLSNDDEMVEVDGFTLSIDQALAVMNGDVTSRISGSKRGTLLYDVLKEHQEDEARIEALYLTVFSRTPTRKEKLRLASYVSGQKDKSAAWEDVFFALLMTTEFATNH